MSNKHIYFFTILFLFFPLILNSQQSTESFILDTCDLISISALKMLIQAEIIPTIKSYNLSIKSDSLLSRINTIFGLIPVETKILKDTINIANYCPMCGKQFTSKDYLNLHISIRHMQEKWNFTNFAICPADLCGFLPCYKYAKSGDLYQTGSILMKRKTECKIDKNHCAKFFIDSVESTHINYTQFIEIEVQKYCFSMVCDEYQRKIEHDAVKSTGKSALLAIGLSIGGVVVFLYYIGICFMYTDQLSQFNKSNYKNK